MLSKFIPAPTRQTSSRTFSAVLSLSRLGSHVFRSSSRNCRSTKHVGRVCDSLALNSPLFSPDHLVIKPLSTATGGMGHLLQELQFPAKPQYVEK